jgi:ubiquinone/menaquinone biosynthesis C-methylase UbiE
MVSEELPKPASPNWIRRFFAWSWNRSDETFHKRYGARKEALFAQLEGAVLEIGAGAGANFQYYPPGIKLLVVEPNPHMHGYLREKAKARGIVMEILDGGGEGIPLDDNCVDVAISILVLCSVTDPSGVLKEIHRVLKPGGRFIFLEHVAAPRGTMVRRGQAVFRPISVYIGDGCHPDRETWADIEAAGFSSLECEHYKLDSGIMRYVAPHIAGTATK